VHAAGAYNNNNNKSFIASNGNRKYHKSTIVTINSQISQFGAATLWVHYNRPIYVCRKGKNGTIDPADTVNVRYTFDRCEKEKLQKFKKINMLTKKNC
jgi:hypothetical protein